MTKIAFNNVSYTEASLNDLSGPALVELYNNVLDHLRNNGSENAKNVSDVRRFADKKSATTRTWKLMQHLAAEAVKEEPAPAPVKAPAPVMSSLVGMLTRAKETPVKKNAKPRGTNLMPPGFQPLPCREGSKQALLLDMLSRKNGSTMAELIEALSGGNKPWTEATVRSGFGWDMKLKGYGVHSTFDEDGTERFHIVLPECAKAIPEHTPLKGKPKADARQAKLAV